jgi:hypothetical protein
VGRFPVIWQFVNNRESFLAMTVFIGIDQSNWASLVENMQGTSELHVLRPVSCHLTLKVIELGWSCDSEREIHNILSSIPQTKKELPEQFLILETNIT